MHGSSMRQFSTRLVATERLQQADTLDNNPLPLIFKIAPVEIMFSNFEPFKNYKQTVTFRNNGNVCWNFLLLLKLLFI